MSNLVKVEVKLKPETLIEIDKLTKFGIIKNEFSDTELPVTNEEFIKSSLDFFINRLWRIKSFVADEKVFALNSKAKLQNKIKQHMIDCGMKQKDLSALTGIDPGSLSHILSNRNQPSMDYFLRIWIVLGYPPIEELFYREGE